jgi:hypothetical protein
VVERAIRGGGGVRLVVILSLPTVVVDAEICMLNVL